MQHNWIKTLVHNFDWTLTSEGTPTSYTGPGTASGGEGAYLFIEANDQTEGEYAAITSSTTGCTLSILTITCTAEVSAHSR
jgi:hypothetical protein